jgi:hypothetical protein
VKVPNGVAGVRGTLFSIDVDGNVACYESTGGGVILSVTIGGVTSTYVIQPGYLMQQGGSSPAPISPELQTILKRVFDVLRTTYFQTVNYEFDRTGCFISPTSGNGQGQNNNNQGQNQQ